MERTPGPLVIDARPRGPRGPIASEVVQGRSLLDRVLELALVLSRNDLDPIAVVVHPSDASLLRAEIEAHPSGRFVIASAVTPGAAVLRTDRLYDVRRLRRTIRRAGDPEGAAQWRLDGTHGLAGADQELSRRRWSGPLRWYPAVDPARWVARALAPTLVSPVALTLSASACLFLGASAVASGSSTFVARGATAALLVVACLLDAAVAPLGRLQGTGSASGRRLRGALVDLGEMALHAAAAWAAFRRTGSAGWLLVGMGYGMGKYLYVTNTGAASRTPSAGGGDPRWLRFAGRADVRWHVWVVLSAVGRLELALAAYAAYYPVLAAAGALRRGDRRA